MEVKLSKRLSTIAGLVPKADTLADIGCDHGLLSIYLVKNEIISRALATDVGMGPLKHAKDNIRDFCLTDKIETRLSDGFKEIAPGEAEVFVIAGMGGLLMIRLLEEGRSVWEKAKSVILSPQRDERLVREYMSEICLWDTDVSLLDEGKIYTAMRFLPTVPPKKHSEKEYIFGLNPKKVQISRFIEQKQQILLSLESGEKTPELLGKISETERLLKLAKEYDS